MEFVTQHQHYDRSKNLFYRCVDYALGKDIVCLDGFKMIEKLNLSSAWNQIFDNIPSKKILCTFFIDIVPDETFWQKVNQVCQDQDKMLYVLTDSWIEFGSLSNVFFMSRPELFGLADIQDDSKYPLINREPKKLFECTVSRVESIRLSWFYFLHNLDLLDKGYVCFLFNQLPSFSTLKGRDLLDYLQEKFGLNKLSHFEKSYRVLRNQVPYINFDNGTDITALVMDSKYSLALETYATNDGDRQWIVYEKTFRALQCTTYPLIFAQNGAIKKLIATGFDVPEELVSIDDENWVVRQQKLLDILKNDSIDEPWQQRYSRAQHNRNLLSTWKKKIDSEKWIEEIFGQIL